MFFYWIISETLVEEVKDLKQNNQDRIIKLEEEVYLLRWELEEARKKTTTAVGPSEINEINEREKRAKNIIVYNVLENLSKDLNTKIDSDTKVGREMFGDMELPPLVKVLRIGIFEKAK